MGMESFVETLKDRFGKISELDVVSQFGDCYMDGILGWQYPPEVIRRSDREGRLLTMDLDIPCACQLNCNYCFAKEDAYYRPQEGDNPLSLDRIKTLLREAKSLGLQSVKIVGFGEPFENPEIFDFISFASSEDIHLVIFTAAYTLGEETFDGSRDRVLDFLYQHRVSLMVKYHTLDHEREERIVRSKGYPKKRDVILQSLLDHGGFNSQSPTRLGLENVIATQSVEELAAIYLYFKIFRNVHTDIDPPIPVGRTATKEQWERIGLEEDELFRLYQTIHSINRRHRLPFLGLSPFVGNAPCSQLPNGLYLTLSGKIVSCCGGNEQYGDVNEGDSIRDAFYRNPYRLGPESQEMYHSCPYREKAGILTRSFLERVLKSLPASG